MELLKKPYEISLWKDELTWVRRELEPINITKEDYHPGEFYYQNPNVHGAIPYSLSYEDFHEGQQYFSLKTDGLKEEGTSEEISIDDKDEWINQNDIYEVVNVGSAFDSEETYYVYNSEFNEYQVLEGQTIPQPNNIYFIKILARQGLLPNTVFTYYKEIRLCTIGSNSMDSPARCVNPKLTQKVNGENVLTFTMYYQYVDNLTGKKEYNPFIKFLSNERKIKLRIGREAEREDDTCCEWYDFIIKSVQESSDSKAFTYTCKDQFVNELSKSGFSIELDNELENNMGTIDELGAAVLQGSDWVLNKSDDLKQYKEEPLYEVTIINALEADTNIIATNMEDDSDTLNIRGKTIYVFYSDVNEKKDQWRFLCLPEGQTSFKTDDDLIIDKDYKNYIIDVEYSENEDWPTIVAKNTYGDYYATLSMQYRGNGLVRQYQTEYDATIDKYVGVYLKDGEEYRGYTESNYVSSGAISNYVANPTNFTSTTGWQTDEYKLDYQLQTKKGENGLYESYLSFVNKPKAYVLNSGVGGNRSSIGEFTKGEKYILRMKYKTDLNGGYNTDAPSSVKICSYHLSESKYVFDTTYFDFIQTDEVPTTNDINEDGNYSALEDYIYMSAECSESVSKTMLTDWDFRIGLFFYFGDNTNSYFIQDVQLFSYETYTEDGIARLCVPGGKLHSEIKTKYVYYEKNPEWKSIDDLIPVYSDYQNDDEFIQQYRAGATKFTKIRSISAKESNRFNLIQELCETFECWPRFFINRNQITGQIKYDDNYRQEKSLTFKEYAGDQNPVGFRYGINSKSIQRTIDSASIVSKMIVKDNSNEFAPNGFCSIARATENPNGENFLLNFDHYVRKQLLNFNDITNDLYLEASGYLGYYKLLKRINVDRNNKIDIQAGLLVDISNYESSYTTYKTSHDSAVDEQLTIVYNTSKYLVNPSLDNTNFDSIVTGLLENEHKDDSKLASYYTKWCQCANVISQHKPLYEKAEKNLTAAKAQCEEITKYLKDIAEQKRALELKFYKKYSRFIQEGSWIKEDYTDPNLYYLDAESTLHTSAQPKVTYNISVIDVAPLSVQPEYEDFKFYKFKLGDRTYIEDVEFFGWSLIDGKTPYREEIIVSEFTTELDSPEKNQIKVQNYKTQFEDLFQRITATTQQAEYHTGEYNRAASIVETDGRISPTTLESSFANNSLKLSNARDQSVVWDETGITSTSLKNPSEMVRIVSGGIFLSTDGGQSWKTGITGSGINTSYLTSGQINTNEIYIMNGNNAAFRWDEKGLSAYYKQGEYYTPTKFVRFDHNGIYGILANDNWSGNDEDIHDSASFALTWSGFSLKNNDGSVRISTDNDIQVLQNSIERIKIGRLSKGEDPNYGISIKNAEGATVMETDGHGDLWLKNALHVGTADTSKVEIGYLNGVRANTEKHEVIHAGDSNETPFIVYEDGHVIANYIQVNGGKIGNMEVAQIESVGYEVLITSSMGLAVSDNTQVTLTANLYKNGQIYNPQANEEIKYQWYESSQPIAGEINQTLTTTVQFDSAEYNQFSCVITVSTKEE